MRKALFGSIQSRLLFSFLLSVVIVIALVGFFNQWIRLQLEAAADTSLLATASTIAAEIEEFNQRNIQSLEMGARLPQLEAFLDADESQRNEAAFRQTTIDTLRSMQIAPWNQFYTLSFAILDLDGINILDTTHSNIGRDESQEPFFQHPLVTGLTSTSALYYQRTRSGVYYYYLVPIRRNVDPQPVIGMIRAEVSVAAVQDLLFHVSMEEAYSDLNIILFDEQMVRLVDSQNPNSIFRSIQDYNAQEITLLSEAGVLPSLPASRLIEPLPALVDELSNLRDPSVFTAQTVPSSPQQDRIAAIRLEENGWYLLVAQPAERFYLPIQRQTEGLYLLSILLMIGALGTSLLISRSVTVPIRQLTHVTSIVAEGNLNVQAPVRSNDEIGKLAETFNQMTRELQHVKSNLEHLVEERTQSLKKSNQTLQEAIKERERLEAQNLHMALEAERTRILSEFIQDASHEFKTPLSVINVKTHLLRRLTDEKYHRHLADIEQQSQSIETIVSAMVLMSKLDSTSELELSPLYVDDFLKSVHELENARFEQFEVPLHLELHAGSAAINVNSAMMRELMHRVLDNARRFTPAGGSVTISSNADAKTVEIRVQDTGIGMNPEILSHIFERFYRGDEAHTTRGFGLGLPISKRIIELSAGEILIESSPMQGTTVIIRLPLSSEIPQSFKRSVEKG